MNPKLLSTIFMLIFYTNKLTNAIDYKPEEGIDELTDDTFDAAIASNKFILVEFYSPRCGWCKKVRPEFVKAAQHFVTEKAEMKLAGVDVTVNQQLKARFNVKGVPMFKFFIDGKLKDYDGGRTADEFITWLKKDHTEL